MLHSKSWHIHESQFCPFARCLELRTGRFRATPGEIRCCVTNTSDSLQARGAQNLQVPSHTWRIRWCMIKFAHTRIATLPLCQVLGAQNRQIPSHTWRDQMLRD